MWGDGLPGYGLRVFPTGKKSYVVQYRFLDCTLRIATGLYGKYTPDLARENALAILTAIAKGGDPSAERQRLSKEIIVSKLCDLYLLNGCTDKKSSTLATDKGRIERHIQPLLCNPADFQIKQFQTGLRRCQ